VPPLRRKAERRSPRTIAVAFGGAALVALALIAASLAGGRSAEAEPAARPSGATEPTVLFRDVPQDGLALGRADAPVTLVEYADLQCPYCAAWARDVLPAIVDDYVRAGKVRLVFRGLAFLGPDSVKALRAALAAGEQDRLWDVVHDLYASQEAENSGWVTDELLRNLEHTGVDSDRMLARTASPAVERELSAAASAAERAGVPGTPSFQAGRTGGALRPLRVTSMDAAAFRLALDALLAR
jgi:protein-disulfide isomerase